jgi:hypothetical protein
MRNAKGLDLALTKETQDFVRYLDLHGRHRYFETSWAVEGHELLQLDWAVWEVRRFAKVLASSTEASGAQAKLRKDEIRRIRDGDVKHPQHHALNGGLLEKILDDKAHRARPALVWHNGCFGKSFRRTVKVWRGFRASNAPLYLHPEILDEVLKYVWLPKDVVDAYRAHRSAA